MEYQKGSENAATDVLSRVPVRHDKNTVQSLLEGAVTSKTERGEVLLSQPLQVEHDHLSEELQAPALKLAPMHMSNWAEAQGEDVPVGHLPEMDAGKKRVFLSKREMHCLEHSD